ERAVAALLRGAACGFTLDDEQLALLGIALLTVGELAGQARELERALALHHLARLAGRLACFVREDRLLDDRARVLRVLLEVLTELLTDDGADRGRHFRRHEL